LIARKVIAVLELLEMLEEDRETAKRGMRIWYEEEFAQIEAEHEKELSVKEAQYKKELAELDAAHAIELAELDAAHAIELLEKDEKIAQLNRLLKTNGIT
jgi:hypothetical protein